MAFLTLKEVSKMINADYFAVRRLVISGKVKGVKVGGSWRMEESQIDNVQNLLKPNLKNFHNAKINKIEGFITLKEASETSKIPITGLKEFIGASEIKGYGDENCPLIKQSDFEEFLSNFKDANKG